jgi:hypothetical protein
MRTEQGSCFCGQVVGRFRGEPLWVCYDHDDDCRRAVGSPLNVWVGYSPDNADIQGTSLRTYSKSGRVFRGFCSTCGTSITYEDHDLPGELYISVGFLDHPQRFTPQAHAYWNRKLPWISLEDALPRHPTNSRLRSEPDNCGPKFAMGSEKQV